MWLLGLEVFALSAIGSWLLTPPTIALARRVGAVDLPGPRKIHTSPIPRIGGIPVLLGTCIGVGYGAFATGFLPGNLAVKGLLWGSLCGAVGSLFLMGLVDDIRGLSFRWKFAVQVAGALLVWWCGFRIENVSLLFGPVDLGPLSVVVTVLWIVGVTNAFNLIDGLDGLAAGTALISTTAVAAIALYRDQVAVTAVSVALVGSLAGFLRFNFAPARIFLGDSGSMLLGFLLAVLSIHASQKGATAVAVLAPILVLGLPIFDTGFAVLRRIYRLSRADAGSGHRLRYMLRNAAVVFLPDRAHLHHRLLDLGLSQRSAVLTLYSGALLTALAALALVVLKSPVVAVLLLLVLGILVAIFVALIIAAELRRSRTQAGTPPNPVASDPVKMRAARLNGQSP